MLADERADLALRRSALTALVEARDDKVSPILLELVGRPALRIEATVALAAFSEPKAPATLLALYAAASQDEKRAIVNTLAARAAYGKALLDAVAMKKVPVADVSADVVRQLKNLRDAALDKRIGEVWGIVRTTPAERVAMIKRYRAMLTSSPKTPPDASLGRALFTKTCAQCHTLFGTGGKVGPEITGSNRANLDYLLENILDPSAVIPKEYAVTVITLLNGRVITGIVRGETPAALTVVTPTETLTVRNKGRRETRAQRPVDDAGRPAQGDGRRRGAVADRLSAKSDADAGAGDARTTPAICSTART